MSQPRPCEGSKTLQEGAEDVHSNSQATPIAFHAAWTNQGSTNGKCRRHAIEVVSSRGGESNRFCDPSHLGAQLFPRIREPAIWYFIWSAPPHSGRPFSTFRAPAARRILCAYGTQYYYGRGSGPWVCVLLGSELASLIPSPIILGSGLKHGRLWSLETAGAFCLTTGGVPVKRVVLVVSSLMKKEL